VAKGIDKALNPLRTGVIVEGMEVPHAHVHLIPIYQASQNFSLGKKINMDEGEMTELAEKISGEIEL
jgi:histidine triad (HIT) family protein